MQSPQYPQYPQNLQYPQYQQYPQNTQYNQQQLLNSPMHHITSEELEKLRMQTQLQSEIQKQLSEQKKQEMVINYQNIGLTLNELLNNERIKDFTDRYNLADNLSTQNPIPREKMANFFKHLLYYTYLATATEIKNHEEVNKQLADIRATLLKLTKTDTAVAPTT
jgi:hypothetical protein